MDIEAHVKGTSSVTAWIQNAAMRAKVDGFGWTSRTILTTAEADAAKAAREANLKLGQAMAYHIYPGCGIYG